MLALPLIIFLQRFNLSAWRKQLKDLLDVDLHAIARKTGIAEHHP